MIEISLVIVVVVCAIALAFLNARLIGERDTLRQTAKDALELASRPSEPVLVDQIFDEGNGEYLKALYEVYGKPEFRFFMAMAEARAVDELSNGLDHAAEKAMFVAGVRSWRKLLWAAAEEYRQKILSVGAKRDE